MSGLRFLVLLVGLGALVSACDTSTRCGKGRRLAQNDRDGALIEYCIGDYGLAYGAYRCVLHGGLGGVEGEFVANRRVGEWRYLKEGRALVRTETWHDGELVSTVVHDASPHAPLACDGKDIYAAPPPPIVLSAEDWTTEPAADDQGPTSVRWYPGLEPPQRWQEGSYVDGLRHGEWAYYYPTGQERGRGRFARGLPHGPWVLHRLDGKRVTGRYLNGLLREGVDVVPEITGARGLFDPDAIELSKEEVRRAALPR